jgi:hypothetical protein
LAKDEEIFQEKMRELKKSRKIIKHLEAEKRLLYEENDKQYQQLQKALYDGAGRVSTSGHRAEDRLPLTPSRAESKHEEDKAGPLRQSPSAAESKASATDRDIANELELEREKEVELSVAVLGAEPDISQLMEDLDGVQQVG